MKRTLCAACVAVAAVHSQDVLHYKFEELGGRKVVNYAARSGWAPTEGALNSTIGHAAGTLFAPGRFGQGALRGTAIDTDVVWVDTGWNGAFSANAFTVALFFRSRRPYLPGTGARLWRGAGNNSYPFLGYVAGQAGMGFGIQGWGGSQPTLHLTRDVYTPSFSRWVHVALVLDYTNLVAQYFVDGVPEIPIPLAPVQAPFGTPDQYNFMLNTTFPGSQPSQSLCDIDEFRFALRAASAAEIAAWAAQDPAADGAYGRGCAPAGQATILSSNSAIAGAPRLGNAGYELQLNGPGGSFYALSLGTNRLALSGVLLPLHLGFLGSGLVGCFWDSSMDLLTLGGSLDVLGRARIPLPVPMDPNLTGFVLYNQTIGVDPATLALRTSNAFAVAVGR